MKEELGKEIKRPFLHSQVILDSFMKALYQVKSSIEKEQDTKCIIIEYGSEERERGAFASL